MTATTDLVLPPRFSSKILKFGVYLHLPTLSLCWYVGLSKLLLYQIIILLTTFNYWRDPKKGWRRNLDICSLFIVQTIHLTYYLPQCSFKHYYLPCFLIGSVCYGMSWRTYPHDLAYSTLFHCGVHVCANTALVLLYTQVY